MKRIIFSITACLLAFVSNTQHEHHMQDTSKPKMQMADTMQMEQMNMSHDNMNMGGMPMMSEPFSLNLPMQRHGSGTAWLPDASPMYAYMFHAPKWSYMLHGNLFLLYTNQDFSIKG